MIAVLSFETSPDIKFEFNASVEFTSSCFGPSYLLVIVLCRRLPSKCLSKLIPPDCSFN